MIIISIFLTILLGTPIAICGAEQEYHVIQTGETLYSIAKSYSIPYDMLANINGITDPSKIRPGTVLLIPQVHIVGKGETYYGIAKKYDISIQELKAANNLSENYVLRVGDVLLIPEHGSASPAVAQVEPASPSSTVPSIGAAPKTTPSSSVQTAPNTTSTAQTSTPSPSTPEKPQTQAPASSPTTASSAQPAPRAGTNSSNALSTGTTPSAEKNEGLDKNASRTTDTLITWPVEGKGLYMSGKLEGIMFQTKKGASVQAIASGTVVSAGPSRGFGQVVFIQSKSGFVYVYGGNESILVKTGDNITPGKTIATVGLDSKEGTAIAYFFVFRNGQPVDPSLAPRE